MRLDPSLDQSNQSQDLKALLEENLRYAKAIYDNTEKAKKYIMWSQILGWAKVIIIAVPLVLAFFYLQPIVKQAVQTLAPAATSGGSGSVLDLLKEYQQLRQAGKLDELLK